ncbi:MAG: xanthine dehydrogenase family protein subunit M [Hyphomicrobiales bacterium]|nr:xanthine dehydrogenase family protein subunit M [Hyphomicrobiales bacterium]
MIPGSFTYLAPSTLPDALALLQQHGGEAKILAGGQSLIPLMRFRLAEPAYLIDVNRIPGLNEIEVDGDHLVIGALTREVDLERSPLVRQHVPILVETSMVIADPLVRNLSTVGGNLTHADPANDHPATMLALRAEVVANGPSGERVIPIDDFFVDVFTSVLAPDEILTAIRVPIPRARSGGAYVKFERKVGDYAVAATAVQLTLAPDGTIEHIGIGLTNASYKPLRAANAEAVLTGQQPNDDRIREAALAAANEADPSSDLRGSAEYKRDMIRTMTGRALRLALERARAA